MENMPIFVKIDEYKEILEIVKVINEKLGVIKNSLQELKDIKSREDDHIDNWESQLVTVSEKMDYINQSLKEM